MTLLLDETKRNTDIGNVTGAIFIDLSKAFDTLSHAQIMESLTSYGVTGTENELFVNYLFGKKQTVCYEKEISKAEFVTCGVPQGSMLGPLLFLITFNDIHSVLSYSNLITYSDDTIIYVSGKNKDEVQSKLQTDFQAVSEWFQSVDLIINMKKRKTECMLFGTVQKVKNKSLIRENNSKVVSHTVTYNFLGVKLDQSLSLREQIDISYKKASGRLYLLGRIHPKLTVEVALTIYKTMLIPLFTYCSIISSTYTETLNQRINSFERRAHEVIFKRKSNFPNNASIRSIQRKRLSTQVFDCVHGNVCHSYNNYFTIMSNKTRNCKNLLRLPKIRSETTKMSFYFNCAKVLLCLIKPGTAKTYYDYQELD